MPADPASVGSTERAADPVRATPVHGTGDVHAKGDAIVLQTLSIARDGAWLDKLARDIAGAGSGGDLQFKLEPRNLGLLSVAISQGTDGASIRLTADNERTRDILVDAQPKLIAEAHAQGLKVSDTQVDVRQDQKQSQNQNPNQDAQRWAQNGSGQNGSSHNGQNRQSSPGHQPFVSNLGRKAEPESESPDRDSDALYA
jgi:flagellar hook-length control protein FliK